MINFLCMTGIMPLVCPLCGKVIAVKYAQLMAHIRLLHADDPNFMIQCNRQGCKRTFRKFTVYKNHVYAFHDTTDPDSDNLPTIVTSDGNEVPEHTDYDISMCVLCVLCTCLY